MSCTRLSPDVAYMVDGALKKNLNGGGVVVERLCVCVCVCAVPVCTQKRVRGDRAM